MVHTVHTYGRVRACGVACMHQACAALQLEVPQGREVAEALRQLNLNVQADGAHAAVCVFVCTRACACANVFVCVHALCCELI